MTKRSRCEVKRRRSSCRSHASVVLACTAIVLNSAGLVGTSNRCHAIHLPQLFGYPHLAHRWKRRRHYNMLPRDVTLHAVISRLCGGGDGIGADSDGDAHSSDGPDSTGIGDITTQDIEDDNEPVTNSSKGNVTKDEKLTKMAYSLSGISRKVEEATQSDSGAKTDDADDVSLKRYLDSDTTTDTNNATNAPKEANGLANRSTDGDVKDALDSSVETISAEDVEEIPDDTPFPLTDLSDKMHRILSRHHKSAREGRKEAEKLRDLVLERCEEFIDDLHVRLSESRKRPRHPRRVLHYLAPKIPAIKQSPDITLRIKSAKADLDGGVAAYAIGSIACLTELYEQSSTEIFESKDNDTDEQDEESSSLASSDIISDRRLEQLVECVLCGIDAKEKLRELKVLERKAEDSDKVKEEGADEESIDARDISSEHLRAKDAAYAAFGLAVLGAQEMTKIGGMSPREVFSVLSLHCRDMLLAQQQHLSRRGRRVDIAQAEEMMDDLVSDVASALWAFSCVKSISGYRSDDLFDMCCSILLLKEKELGDESTRLCQDMDVDVASNMSQAGVDHSTTNTTSAIQNRTNATSTKPDTSTDSNSSATWSFEDTLIGRLTQREAINALWALAIHGSSDNKALHWGSESESEARAQLVTSEVLTNLLLQRIGHILDEEISKHVGEETLADEDVVTKTKEDDEGKNEVLIPCGNSESSSSKYNTVETSVDINFSEQPKAEGSNDNGNDKLTTNEDDGKDEGSNGQKEINEVEKYGEDESIQGDGEIIKVISAAAILEEEARQREDKSSKQDKAATSTLPEVAMVEVIDATATVRAKVSQSEVISKDQGAPETHRKGEEAIDREVTDDTSETHRKDEEVVNKEEADNESMEPQSHLISINDLCSIAWAATELGRGTSVDVVWRITILYCYSRESFMALGGTGLSNLAWSIAKTFEVTNGSDLKPHIRSLVYGIAERSLAILLDQSPLSKTAHGKSFQPPELSRLLWSISLIESTSKGILSGDDERIPVFSELAAVAMKIAAFDLPVFSVEDLARILWAFTELTDTTSESNCLRVSTVESFGRIQETIEASLLRWESGQKNTTASEQNKDSGNSILSRFPSTLFGKARARRVSLLNLKISDEDEGDDDDTSPNHVRQKQTSLPTLKDLTVDPSTLCKLAFGLAQISRSHHIVGSEQILRVATRLFSSKNGRLLSECSNKDVIRMCCACVDTMKLSGKEIRGSDREYVLRQFPRRVVQLINTPVMVDGGIQRSYLEDLSASDLSALLFALGELGVKASYHTDSPHLEHRKLRMVPACPAITEESLESLTPDSAVNLISGLIAIGDASRGSTALLSVMLNLNSRVESLKPYLSCRLTASLSKLLRTRDNAPVTTSTSSSTGRASMQSPLDESTSVVQSSSPSANEAEEYDTQGKQEKELDLESAAEQVIENLSPSSNEIDISTEEDEERVHNESQYLLNLVLERAATRISEFSAEQIRRILLHVVLLPFRADKFVDAAEAEVSKRLLALDADAATTRVGTLQDLSQYAADAAVDVAATLSASSSNGEHPFNFLKRGGKEKDFASAKLSDLTAEANRAAASACEAAARLDRVNRGAHLNGEEILQQIEQGAAFELGRCQTLIERYRRIEFTNDGCSRRSRYDDERRKIIGKRVCSRLFA